MNLPNKLSVMRILLVPLIVILYLLAKHTGVLQQQIAFASFTFDLCDLLVLVLFAVASFTDFLDGYIARRDSLVTSFGKVLAAFAV